MQQFVELKQKSPRPLASLTFHKCQKRHKFLKHPRCDPSLVFGEKLVEFRLMQAMQGLIAKVHSGIKLPNRWCIDWLHCLLHVCKPLCKADPRRLACSAFKRQTVAASVREKTEALLSVRHLILRSQHKELLQLAIWIDMSANGFRSKLINMSKKICVTLHWMKIKSKLGLNKTKMKKLLTGFWKCWEISAKNFVIWRRFTKVSGATFSETCSKNTSNPI